MTHTLWKIFLALFLLLTCFFLITNIRIEMGNFLLGLCAGLAAIFLLMDR